MCRRGGDRFLHKRSNRRTPRQEDLDKVKMMQVACVETASMSFPPRSQRRVPRHRHARAPRHEPGAVAEFRTPWRRTSACGGPHGRAEQELRPRLVRGDLEKNKLAGPHLDGASSRTAPLRRGRASRRAWRTASSRTARSRRAASTRPSSSASRPTTLRTSSSRASPSSATSRSTSLDVQDDDVALADDTEQGAGQGRPRGERRGRGRQLGTPRT